MGVYGVFVIYILTNAAAAHVSSINSTRTDMICHATADFPNSVSTPQIIYDQVRIATVAVKRASIRQAATQRTGSIRLDVLQCSRAP